MNYLFITGSGRSGTTFLAQLLNEITNDIVKHEYIGNRREYWLLSHFLPSEVYAIPYLIEYRKYIESTYDTGRFIDVNSYLQNSIPELKEVFQTKNIFGLVREGRDVVRSFYRRRPSDDVPILCDVSRSAVEAWLKADKFERLCYHWVHANENLISNEVKIIQLERLLSDYTYFVDQLLRPLGYVCEQKKWNAIVSKRINRTRSKFGRWMYSTIRGKKVVMDELPHWKEWRESEKTRFCEICGPTMRKLGYDLTSW